MAPIIAARASERTQRTRKAGGRKPGPQSVDVAVTDILIEAIVALIGTEHFMEAHEQGECHVIIEQHKVCEAHEHGRINKIVLHARLDHLRHSHERLVLSLRDHRKRMREQIIPQVQSDYRAVEAMFT